MNELLVGFWVCGFWFQHRDTCYVASPGLPQLVYSGYQPHAYSWDDLLPLKEILEAVITNIAMLTSPA